MNISRSNGGLLKMKRLPDLSDMEHVSSAEFGEKMDAILDRIIADDILFSAGIEG
jgi:hypothetical protein